MIKVNELFAGIGAFRKALIRTNIPHSVVGISEIDNFAIKSYEAIYGKTKNYGDISKVDKLDYADLWTYGFPCQDISVAGKQAGINKHTRSGLLYEVERLLEKSKECGELPKYLMLENVKNLVGKKFKAQFDEWIQRLDELGFNTYWQVLNAKNYGIPQNRERVFAISIRKDIDTGYVFPEPFDNGKRLKDILEDEVDEKYYINNEKADKLIRRLNDTNQLTDKINPCDGTINEPKVKDISNCIKARYDCGVSNQRSDGTMVVETMNQKRTGGLYDGETKHQAGSVWDSNHVAPTVDTMQGGNRQPCVLIPQATKQGYKESNYRIRKLTPKECWRLMGFTDEQFQKAEEVNSNSQLYKQAGNSIVVNVLEVLMTQLLGKEQEEKPVTKTRSQWLDELLGGDE